MGWAVICAASVGCGGEGPGGIDAALDARPDTGSATCAEACDDGLYCNGTERCAPDEGGADARGCVAGTSPCEGPCDEASRSCEGECDGDGDLHEAIACGGDDCDDDDGDRFPGNTEVCDADDHDEDCDPTTFGWRDIDGDSDPDAACCNEDHCGTDCDDARPSVSSTSPEICEEPGLDNDCDGEVNEGVLRTFYADADGDGYGSSAAGAETRTGCEPPSGFVERATDCDDGDGTVNPGNMELCDTTGRDENCSGMADEGCACLAPSSRSCADDGAVGRCAAGTQACDAVTGSYGACSILPALETCNYEDDDCNGTVDDGLRLTCFIDGDGDSYATAGARSELLCPSGGTCPAGYTDRAPAGSSSSDCDDSLSTGPVTHPGATEVCNGRDDDCDGSSDEGLRVTCYADADGDTYAATGATSSQQCPDDARVSVGRCPVGYTNRSPATADCAPADSSVHPGAAERCSDIDYDCDGDPYDGMICRAGATRDCGPRCTFFGGYGGTQTCTAMGTACGWNTCVVALDDTCDGVDDDCDGLFDELAGGLAGCRTPIYRRHLGSSAIRSSDTLLTGSATEGGSSWSGPTGAGATLWVYSSARGIATERIRRCYRSSNGRHFFTLEASCPSGWTNEGTLGYAVAADTALLYEYLVLGVSALKPVFVLTDGVSWLFTIDPAEYVPGTPSGNSVAGVPRLWREPNATERTTWNLTCDVWPRAMDLDACAIMAVWDTRP